MDAIVDTAAGEKMDARLEKKLIRWQGTVGTLREHIGGLLDKDGFLRFVRTRYIGLGGMRPIDLLGTDDGVEMLVRFIDEVIEAWEPHPISL